MTNTEQALSILVAVLICVQILNFYADNQFREDQVIINDNFLKLHENAVSLDLKMAETISLINERLNIVIDELFDRIWEDLEQT